MYEKKFYQNVLIIFFTIIIAFPSIDLWTDLNSLQAQQDDFNTRIIQDQVFAMHLYRDKLLKDKYRPTYHFVIPTHQMQHFLKHFRDQIDINSREVIQYFQEM